MDGCLDTSLTGLTELRVHGVSGTPPESMLNHPHPRLVAGDATAGFYRRWYPGGGGDDEVGVRHREAYSWGGLTSGAGVRALWLLLLPFMLANVAHWMRPPAGFGARGKMLSDLGDRLLRLFALLLTCTLLLGAAGPVLDLAAWQCGGSAACLREHGWLTVLRSGPLSAPGRRVALLALVPAALLGFVWWLGSRTWRNYELVELRGEFGESDSEKELRQPGFWHGAGPVGRLRSLHVTAGTALLGTLVAAPIVDRDGLLSVAGFLLLVNLGLLLAAGIAVLLQRIGDRGAKRRDDQHQRHDGLLVGTRWAAILLLVADLAAASWPRGAGWRSSESLPGMEVALQITFGLEFAVLLLFGATVALQRPWQTPERESGWRPAVGGFAAPIVATLAWLLVQAFVAGLYLRIGDFLGRPYSSVDRADAAARRAATAVASTSLPLPERLRAARLGAPLVVPADFYWAAAQTMVFIAVAVVVGVVVWTTARRRTRAGYEAVCRDYPDADVAPPAAHQSAEEPRSAELFGSASPHSQATTGDPTRDRWLWSIARARAMASLTDSAGGAVAIMLVSAFALAVGGFIWHLVTPDLIVRTPWSALANAGTWAMAGLAGALIAVGRTAYNSPTARRTLGVAWDLGSFWPRAAHPLAPPCYAERAVPDLIFRLTSLTTTASESGRPETGHVVLSSHSQGTILAAAAVLQLPAGVRERVGLMTYGSPLRRLYARYFPAYFGRDAVRDIGELLAHPPPREDGAEPRQEQDTAVLTSWRNLYRLTDPIGGWVLAEAEPAPALTGAVDQLLSDPELDRRRGDASYPPIRAHSDYFDDPRYEQALAWVHQSILTIDVTDPVLPAPADQSIRP
jgi:hypothetical protein